MRRRTFLQHTSRALAAAGIVGPVRLDGLVFPGAAQDAFTKLRDRYFVRVLELNPVTSTYLGGDGYSSELHDVNGRLRDYRAEALENEVRFYRDVQRSLAEIPVSGLDARERVDHAVLGAQLAFILHQLEDLHYYQRAVDTYVAEPFRGVDWQLQQMTDAGAGRLGTEEEWRLVVSRLRAIPAYLEAARANLEAGKRSGNMPDRRMVQRDGIVGGKANAAYFEKTLPAQARQYIGSRDFGAAVLRDLDAASSAASRGYADFAAFLGKTFDPKETADRFAVGAKEYEWRVHNNLRDARSVDELWRYGAEQVAQYQERVYDVAERIARDAKLGLRFGTTPEKNGSVRAVMDHLAKDSPKNDAELLAWYVEAGKRAVAYGREHQLFDIPADYRLDVYPTPPVLRSTIDAAYYPAPPFKKSGVGRFYLTPTGNDPAALKLNSRASVADTAIHEGFPGHDWHFKYMTQHASQISNIRWLTPGAVEDSSSMWEDSPAAEGWGLYAEELMSEPVPGREYGFYTPGEYLYELQGQLLRAVRVRVDVGLHTGRMTFDEAKDYFTENVEFYPNACGTAGSDPRARAICDGAERAIYRYSKWPTQAITYNLGKNAILDLREAYRKARGAAFSEKAFHEKFMGMGTIPVGYYRETFLAEA